jgi:hypothetical protein
MPGRERISMQSDFKDLLSGFCASRVEFLLVGAHAMAVHGHVRATKDLDVWIRPTPENASRIFKALIEFGAPLLDLTEADLATPGTVFQIGVPPLRIDLVTRIDGVAFEDAWGRRVLTPLDGFEVPTLSRADLIANKRATGRLRDLADVEELEKLGS